MTHPKNDRRRPSVAIAATGLALAFCGAALASPASAATKTTKASTPAKASAAVKGPTTFPKLKVLDLATAKSMDLATLNVTKKPQLVWFWAPT